MKFPTFFVAGLFALTPSALFGSSIIAQWSFPDQGFGGTADLSATTTDFDAVAGDITLGSGYGSGLTQLNGGGSYIDASGNERTDDNPPDGGTTDAFTDTPYYYVGDWVDGTSGGGGFLPGNETQSDRVLNEQAPRPAGGGPGGAGALFVSSPAQLRNDISEAVTNELFLTFTLKATTGFLRVDEVSFYASRAGDASGRAWRQWFLEVDTGSGSGFSTLAQGVANSIPGDDETWGLETAEFESFFLNAGEEATFRLGGVTSNTSQFGRGTAIDDITISGIPEPSLAGVAAFAALGVIALRRR